MPSLIRSAGKILSPRIANASAADSVNTSFDMTVRTTAANETFTVPCQNVGTFNATVDWGDGSTSAITAYNDADLVHTYASAGDHSISISGTFPNIYFDYAGDNMKVIAVTNLGEVGWQTFKNAFMGCENMTAFNFGTHTDTSSITDMSGMFRGCKRISTLNLSTLNTSSVTNFSRMFSSMMSDVSTYPASLDASGLDTSNGTDFSYMFHFMLYSTSLNVSNLDTSNATNMNGMFAYNIWITSLDVSSLDTSNVTYMDSMFGSCWALTSLDLSNFDTSNVLYFNSMFNACSALSSLDISSFRTPNARGMIAMFYGCKVLGTIDVSNFYTSNVIYFDRMFDQRYSTNPRTDIIGVENFNFEGITSSSALSDFMRGMSIPTSRYDQLLINIEAQTIPRTTPAHFGTSQYTPGGTAAAARASIISTDGWTITDGGALSAPFDMTVRTTAANETFAIPCGNVGTFNATVDWGDGSSSTVTTYNDSNLAHTYASAGDHAISISGTFPNINFADAGDKSKVIAVTNLGTVGWQSFIDAFYGCGNMTSFTSGVTDTSSVTSMLGMFSSCASLTSLDLSNFDTSSVTDMTYMFSGMTQLQSIDVSSFDTSSVTSMYQVFVNCSSLTSLDLSNFNTSSVTSMIEMFWLCGSLTSLDLSSFNTSSVTSMASMFEDCNNVTDINGVENFDIEGITSTSGLNNFMINTSDSSIGATLPTSRYDALLINWDAQDPLDGMFPHFGGSQYTAGGTAAAARANLISTDGWTITDGGTA